MPEVVSRSVTDGKGLPVRVVPTEGKLVGVTHAADLPVVTAELARQVAVGRPAAENIRAAEGSGAHVVGRPVVGRPRAPCSLQLARTPAHRGGKGASSTQAAER